VHYPSFSLQQKDFPRLEKLDETEGYQTSERLFHQKTGDKSRANIQRVYVAIVSKMSPENLSSGKLFSPADVEKSIHF